ncbi:MAG: hypothetical protein JNM30_17550 [Rhodospirillales bacterium]|nr:hypothetical protein [Rhodospirillales bacterium]
MARSQTATSGRANFCFGDDDLRSLYVTASSSLLRLRVKVPGLSLGPLP